jgi:peptidoglycan/xylan/chitin deacetylase (PgdA/CDA1 family)
MSLVFRDDDTSYFTTPALLEQVYAPVWERNQPVCLSVIPHHYANIQVANVGIDPNIAPAWRGQDRRFPVIDNAELCAYLNNLVKQGLVEIVLHGYDHVWMEFKSPDINGLRKKLRDGRALLEEAFPHAPITTFIAPYNAVTNASIDLILSEGFNFQFDRWHMPADNHFASAPINRVMATQGGARLMVNENSDYLQDAQAWLNQLADPEAVVVCCNHCYMFYAQEDWVRKDERAFAKWHDLLSQIAGQKVVRYADVFNTSIFGSVRALI